MRILYIHQHFAQPKGAGGVRSYQMARRLITAGHRVTMLCGRGKEGQSGLTVPFVKGVRRGTIDDIDVIEVDLPYSNNLSFLQRSLVFLRFMVKTTLLTLTERYDLLFATTTPLTVGVPGVMGKLLRRKPFVFEVRDLWPELPRALGVIHNPLVLAALSALEWVSYRSADRTIGLSPGIVEGIMARGVRADRVALIPNGCDLDIFGDEAQPWAPKGVAPSELLAIFPGAHGLANGLDAVLNAAAVLNRRGRSDIKIVLVGDGMQKPQLMARAQAAALTNVIFLDPVPKIQLAGLMRRADIGLQILANVPAFYRGTSPNKFFDYLAAGKPVLNNYPGWLADLILTHDCGYAIPPEDPTAFADALEQAADDREARERKGRNARTLAENEFARDQLAGAWMDWTLGVRPCG